MPHCILETIQFDNHIPARIIVGNQVIPEKYARMHKHREIELIYMLEGRAVFEGMGQLRTLESDELILFNSEEPHRVMSDEIHRRSHHIVLHLSYEYAEEYDKNMESIYFELNPHAAKKLKPLLLELVRLTYNRHHNDVCTLFELFAHGARAVGFGEHGYFGNRRGAAQRICKCQSVFRLVQARIRINANAAEKEPQAQYSAITALIA